MRLRGERLREHDSSSIAISTSIVAPQKELSTPEAPSSTGSFTSTLRDLLWKVGKPIMAIALGAQLFLGTVAAHARAPVLGTWSPQTEVVHRDSSSEVESGPAQRLRQEVAPKLATLQQATRARSAHQQDRALATTRLESAKLNHGSLRDVLAENTRALAALDAKIAAEKDPIEQRLLGDDRASLVEARTDLLANGKRLAAELSAAEQTVARLDAKSPLLEKAVKSAEKALKSELARAEHLVSEHGVSMPWIIRDASLRSLGLTPPNTEAERVFTFAARVEAWVARNGTAPTGEELNRLAISPNPGIEWALFNTSRDIVLSPDALSTVKSFDHHFALAPAKKLAAALGRDTSSVDIRDLQMFAQIPRDQHDAFINQMIALRDRAGALHGPLYTFAELRGADLDAAADLAKRSGRGLSAELLGFFAMGANGHAHQKEQVAWLLQHARFEGREGEAQLAENFAAYNGRELAGLERLAARLGRPLTVAEVSVATKQALLDHPIDTQAVGLPAGEHALKDLYFLENRAPLSADRDTLLAELNANLRPGAARRDRVYTEDLSSALPKLSTVELQKIVTLQRALASGDFAKNLAALMRTDAKDASTELGGRLLLSNGAVKIDAQNGSGQGNNAFVVGPSFNPFEAFLSFHFHAVGEHGEPENAGPSAGKGADLGTAYSIQLDGLVITQVAKDRMNIDFYTSTGVVLDLGTFVAP